MTIMLVRENNAALGHLKQMVEECYPGSTIATFSSAEEAIKMIKTSRQQIELCFTEILINGRPSGFRIVEELHRRNRWAKAVLISRDKDYALEAWQIHVNDYLLEPLTIEDIRHAQSNCK